MKRRYIPPFAGGPRAERGAQTVNDLLALSRGTVEPVLLQFGYVVGETESNKWELRTQYDGPVRVTVEYERREQMVHVLLRYPEGGPVPFPSFSLRAVLLVRAPGVECPNCARTMVEARESLERLARLLEEYAADILRGDAAFLRELDTLRRQEHG